MLERDLILFVSVGLIGPSALALWPESCTNLFVINHVQYCKAALRQAGSLARSASRPVSRPSMAQLQLLLVCTACTVLLLDAFSQSRRCYCTLSTARHARTSAAILWSSKGSEDELKQSLKEKIEVSDLTKANNEMSAMEKVLVDEQFLQQLTSQRS